MNNVANCITPKTTSEMENQVQQQPMPLQDVPLLSTCPKPVVETQILTISVTQTYPVNDVKNEQIELEEKSISKKSDTKFPIKQKIKKKEWKKHLNAQMRRLVSPKTPLMIFSELFKDVPIQLQEHKHNNNVLGYTATIEIDGHKYTANHTSKTQAKQKACENLLRIMLAKKISEQSEKKKKSSMKTEMEGGEIGMISKPKRYPQEDFPWPHFASLAMHNLFLQWKLQPASKAINLQEQFNAIKSSSMPKIGAMKKFPDNPSNYNPIQLINHMKPGMKLIEIIHFSKRPSIFRVKYEIDNFLFFGLGSTKKAAKKECCISAIKYFWKFDFHAKEDCSLTNK
ncbi:PREDICTED: uncharacterized protein LOC107170983 [Diuraphis noxia]|uniref:uncharacterized protein LOC107170983 n=1 Tax=Diuraphis noxia TaxID=143948 RepID=UPI0007635E60|nr:PREDICTED: uncharacterized protein LOC107170983 [Diuraphis noxia]